MKNWEESGQDSSVQESELTAELGSSRLSVMISQPVYKVLKGMYAYRMNPSQGIKSYMQ